MILSVENSAVKLMRGCRLLMLLMNCSRLVEGGESVLNNGKRVGTL